jgi:hypothetical protein
MCTISRLDGAQASADAAATTSQPSDHNAATQAAILRAKAMHPSNYRGLSLVGALAAEDRTGT